MFCKVRCGIRFGKRHFGLYDYVKQIGPTDEHLLKQFIMDGALTNKDRDDCLFDAIGNNNHNLVKLLLESGVSINAYQLASSDVKMLHIVSPHINYDKNAKEIVLWLMNQDEFNWPTELKEHCRMMSLEKKTDIGAAIAHMYPEERLKGVFFRAVTHVEPKSGLQVNWFDDWDDGLLVMAFALCLVTVISCIACA